MRGRVCERVCDEAQEQQRVDGAAERRGRLRGMLCEVDESQQEAWLVITCCKCSCSKQEHARLMKACQLPLLPLLEEVGKGGNEVGILDGWSPKYCDFAAAASTS